MDIIATIIVNLGLSIGGTVLLSMQFGWKAGIGFLALALFIKPTRT